MKNGRTIDEWTTTAMLLGPGWWYDWHDHTICFDHSIDGKSGVTMYEPETMTPFGEWSGAIEKDRYRKVMSGEIGASDAKRPLRKKEMPDHG